ncbi:hypothetical protein EWM64_g878, partial [Hericium alpestre]
DAAHSYSFKLADPHDALVVLIGKAAQSDVGSQLAQHVQDYGPAVGKFSLSLGQQPDLDNPTDQLWDAYRTNAGNPYLEWLLFNYGRYMLISSSRGLLSANLQGMWAFQQSNDWGADYHANINLQMNYWMAEMTNMDVAKPLFDYIEKTWVPRGTETAQILYNISRGWVTHDEMNIFGHTGMKLNSDDSQASVNYPECPAWMVRCRILTSDQILVYARVSSCMVQMIHVWDHFDYTHDVDWWKAQGWALLRGATEFQLQKLIPDLHFNDSTLVVSPCNSPEQTPVTFGCPHAQQVIWQLFNSAEKGYQVAEDTDSVFLDEVRTKRSQMDKGIHIGSWGQLQGPVPQNGNLHNYTTQDVIDAATISLIHRGNGTDPDADSGWEKVWRAAQWAQLGNATEFYHELSVCYMQVTQPSKRSHRNFGHDLFSRYNPNSNRFQIDANLAYPAVLLNGLIQAPDIASYSAPLNIILLPALPTNWPSGSIHGARIHGGRTLDLEWSDGKPTQATITTDQTGISRTVDVVYAGRVVKTLTAGSSSTQTISF